MLDALEQFSHLGNKQVTQTTHYKSLRCDLNRLGQPSRNERMFVEHVRACGAHMGISFLS